MARISSVKLQNGMQMPALGLGCCHNTSEQMEKAVDLAIQEGYRLIDTAYAYRNEDGVGRAINKNIDSRLVKREDLFVVTKLWDTFHRPDLVKPALQKSLDALGLSYVDMYIMHHPYALKEGEEMIPKGADGKLIPSDVDYLDTWKAMEDLVKQGLVKSIGVSNFNSQQVKRLVDNGSIIPQVNQVEYHPYLDQSRLQKFCEEQGVLIMGWSPLASPGRAWISGDDPRILDEPVVKEIGQKYGKSVAQVAIRWSVQKGAITIPKASSRERLAENLKVFDFSLTEEEVKMIGKLNRNHRVAMGIYKEWGTNTHKYFPYNIEY